MDSLIRVELKQTLEREYNLPVTKEFLLSLTVGDLKAIDAGDRHSFLYAENVQETAQISNQLLPPSSNKLMKHE